jgi:hypothetical protein
MIVIVAMQWVAVEEHSLEEDNMSRREMIVTPVASTIHHANQLKMIITEDGTWKQRIPIRQKQ